MGISRFEDLLVWQKAHGLAVAVYRASSDTRFRRDPALRDQLRRAAVSVASNIAEGFERYSRAELRHFLSIARGSAAEVRCQLLLAHELRYLDGSTSADLQEQCLEVSRLLAAFRRSLP